MSKLGENTVKCANTSSTRNYAENLRVLAVDDNVVCLKFLSALLKKCNYRFTTTTKASEAYKILMNNRDSYDLVLTNVKANMDGFRFAKMILEIRLDIPVVFVSANDGRDFVSEGVSIGADYIPKPVRLEDVRLIWKHVAKRDYLQKSSPKKYKIYPSLIDSVTWDRQNPSERETETKTQVKDDNKEVPTKKQRFKWVPEMHDKFVAAINKLGIENAIPKRILEIMNEPTLSRENVASHLQKYRKNLDKEKGHAKISSSIVNKHTIHWSQSTWPRYELQGTYSRTAENENDHFESAACFSGGHNPNGGSMPLPTNSLPVRLLSSSNGRNQLHDSTKSPQILLPTTFIPMPPSISSYGPNQLHGSTQLTRMSYPINSRALPPSSATHLQGPTQSIHIDETVDYIITVPPRSSCGQLERPSSLDMLQNYSEDYLNSDIENDEDLRAMWEVHSAPVLDHPN